MYCFGELCTLFVLSVGGISVFVLACMIAAAVMGRSSPTDLILILVSIAAFIILIVAATPLSYGAGWYRIQQIRGISVHARSIFSCYTSARKLWQVLRLNSILILKKLPVMIPAAIISAAMFYIAGVVDENTDGNAAYYIMFFAALLVTFIMLGLVSLYSVRYAAVPYLYALGPERPSSELISESKRIMKGQEKYLSEVMFSLSLWLLPCLTIFPMIFIVPYMQMVYTAVINEIITSGAEGKEEQGDVINVEAPLSV